RRVQARRRPAPERNYDDRLSAYRFAPPGGEVASTQLRAECLTRNLNRSYLTVPLRLRLSRSGQWLSRLLPRRRAVSAVLSSPATGARVLASARAGSMQSPDSLTAGRAA